MSTQEIQNYKLNWLMKRCFKVKVHETTGEHADWLKENIEEKAWDFSVNPENQEHTFFFQNAIDAGKFREEFQGESRTVDIN